MVDKAGLLFHEMAAGENGEVWNAPDIEAGRQVGMAFGIHFEDDGSPAHFSSGPCNFRSGHSARTAPGGPEIDQHRHPGLFDDFVEQLRIDFQGFADGTQRGFASSAASGVCQTLNRDAVLPTTRLTGS